jgi:hypothetical protein
MVYNPNQRPGKQQRADQAMQGQRQVRPMNPNQAPPQRQVRPMNPNQAPQAPRQVRPMSNTTATKPTGAQAVGQVYRPNAAPRKLPPRQLQRGGGAKGNIMDQMSQGPARAGGLMQQQETLQKQAMPPSKGQQRQGDPAMAKRFQQMATQGPLPANAQNRQGMEKSLQQSQSQWDNLPPSERAKYEAGGTRRPEGPDPRPMNPGLMQTQTGNANDVAPQMMAQNQSNPTAGATGKAAKPAGTSPANRPVTIQPPAPPEPTPTMGFDADTMTVEGRLQGLMASDNPLMQQARLQAQQQSASRGLQNSSMAVQSGQQAAYASMMPIASQDANTAYDSEKTEYGTRADSALMNQDYLNSRGLAQQGFGYDSSLMDKDIEGKRSIQLDRFGQETSLQEGDFAGRTDLQNNQNAANTARDATKFTSDTALQEQGIAGQQSLQTDAQKASTAAAAAKFQSDTSLQAQGITGQQTLQTDAQKAQTARDATKFQSDTSLQAQGIAGQKDLQGNQIRSNEQIAADRNATAIETTTIGATAQLGAAQISANAAVSVASSNNAAAAARQKTQLQGQALLAAQNQSFTESNMTIGFQRELNLQTKRINADADKYAMGLDSKHQLSYAGSITNLQLGVQQEHSAIAQNPEMNPAQKLEAHTKITNRFNTDSALQASIYGFEADDE